MMKTFVASTPKGRASLRRLALSRMQIDFDTLSAAMPIVRAVLSDPKPPAELLQFIEKFDGAKLSKKSIVVDPKSEKVPRPPREFVDAIRIAHRRLTEYHEMQVPEGFAVHDEKGTEFLEMPVAHEAAGIYVPGGRAFYPSSLLMGVVPAQVAGVKRIVVATPPRAWNESAELRWLVRDLGIREVLLAGGAHGVAGLASFMRCTKIAGPGNKWVAAAKHLVSGLVSVDLPAGPSEVLIIATAGADPGNIAADLLAQAEHDPDAICLLFAVDEDLVKAVNAELEAETARASLEKNGAAFVFASIKEAVAAGKDFAPEHLQLIGREAEKQEKALLPFSGAVFLGNATPTAFGDYLAGPNHVLPTGGAARSFSGLSTRDFYRWGRSVELSRQAAKELSGAAAALAHFEGLFGHEAALRRRGGA
jgi:histidinol dehydrogenase